MDSNRIIRIKRGFDINLMGKAKPLVVKAEHPDTFAVKPTDFQGIQLAKALVNRGDNVKAGAPLFYDKFNEKVMHVAPVSGEIAEVKRGAKRKLLEITILADREVEHVPYRRRSVSEINNIEAEEVRALMLEAGVWPHIVERPFGLIARPEHTPKAIYISTFDTHPLAPEYGILFKDEADFFKAGIEILRKLTDGPVHLNTHAGKEVSAFFSQIDGVTVNKFLGPHPSGCVGVQIHHINPINKGDIVWTINPFGVIQIGKLFLKGIHDAARIVAVTGSEVKTPKYYSTYTGASVKKMLAGNLENESVRVISGNVLTGTRIEKDGHVGYFDHQITVIQEGDERRFLHWAAPTIKELSYHRSFGLLSFLRYAKAFIPNTNTHGEGRSFVQTGAFERVTPMDILPTYLMKSIIAKDIDEMEELGIYEVIEEDLALCEFIDVSKHDIQRLLREGMTLLQNS